MLGLHRRPLVHTVFALIDVRVSSDLTQKQPWFGIEQIYIIVPAQLNCPKKPQDAGLATI